MSDRGMTILTKQGHLCGQSTAKVDFYKHCIFGKQKRAIFNLVIHRTNDTFDYYHSKL